MTVQNFPDRPWFAEWVEAVRKHGIATLCEKVIAKNTAYDWRTGKLSGNANPIIEALYEFCAARGMLATFDAEWEKIERRRREGDDE